MNIISKLIFEILPSDEKISVIDCGARGGSEVLKWSALVDHLILYGFEPDQAECERLNLSAQTREFQHFYYPICLAQTNEKKRNFFIAKSMESSSLYKPNESQISRWKTYNRNQGGITPVDNYVGTDKVVEIPTTTLDTWADINNIKEVDFIKLDVQGAELEILKGADKLLKTVLGLETEVEFIPLYADQPLFADIDIFLRKQDFTFFQFHFPHGGHFVGRILSPINVMHQGDTTFTYQMAGQLLTADAMYLRDPINQQHRNMRDLSMKRILKLVCISELIQQIEYAFELLAWLRQHLIRAGDKHNVQIIEQIYTRAAELYKNPSVNQYQPI